MAYSLLISTPYRLIIGVDMKAEPEMFIYARNPRLAEKVSSALQLDDYVLCSDPDDLAARLKRPDHEFRVGILALRTREELVDLVDLRDLLKEVHLVVVLEEDDQRTVSLAHQLESRYLGLRAQSPAEARSTINHIISRLKSELDKTEDENES